MEFEVVTQHVQQRCVGFGFDAERGAVNFQTVFDWHVVSFDVNGCLSHFYALTQSGTNKIFFAKSLGRSMSLAPFRLLQTRCALLSPAALRIDNRPISNTWMPHLTQQIIPQKKACLLFLITSDIDCRRPRL
jgi:hypothetical protein